MILQQVRAWKQRRAEKAQYDREKYLHSTIRAYEGSGKWGAKPRPTDQTALVNRFSSWCYACAMLNARAIAAVPLRLYVQRRPGRRGATRSVPPGRRQFLRGENREHRPSKTAMLRARNADGIEEVTDHPILDLLHYINPWLDGYNFNVLRMLNLQLTGNSYTHVVLSDQLGTPAELWVMPSHKVQIVPDRETDFIDSFVYGTPPDDLVYPHDEVLFSKISDPCDAHYGRGWVHAAAAEIDLLNAMNDYELALFDNMARPDWGVFISQALTDDQFRRIEAQIDRHLRGVKRTGRPYIFEGGADARPLQFSPRDLAFGEGEERKIEAVAAIAGVPVSKLKANDPNLSNAELGDYGWMKDTIAPYLVLDEEFLNQSLVPYWDKFGEGLFLAYDNPIPKDEARDNQIVIARVGAGLVTINEARAEQGAEPVEGGDVPRINGTALSKLDEPTPGPMDLFASPRSRESEGISTSPSPRAAGGAAPRVKSAKAMVLAGKGLEPLDALPDSGKIRGFLTAMRRILGEQVDAVLADPMRWADVMGDARWSEAIAAEARPFIESAVARGGSAAADGLGSVFDVTNPEVSRFVDDYTVRLARSVQGTNTERLRTIFGEGMEAGENIGQLSNRVREWGGSDVTAARAEMIARTESARALVAGEEVGWRESGVVVGKRWMLSPDPCPFCEEAAKAFNATARALGEVAFAKGSTLEAGGRTMRLDYDNVTGPPLHPHCRCDLEPVLEGE